MTLTFLATVFSSGAVAALISFMLASRRDQFLSRQQKLEALYLAADEYDRMLAAVGAIALVALKHGKKLHEFNDSLPKASSSEPNAVAKMMMLASFYFPAVIPAIEEHERSRARMVAAMAACENSRGSFADFDRAFMDSEAVGQRLRAAIIAEGQKYSQFEILPPSMTWLLSSIKRPFP